MIPFFFSLAGFLVGPVLGLDATLLKRQSALVHTISFFSWETISSSSFFVFGRLTELMKPWQKERQRHLGPQSVVRISRLSLAGV